MYTFETGFCFIRDLVSNLKPILNLYKKYSLILFKSERGVYARNHRGRSHRPVASGDCLRLHHGQFHLCTSRDRRRAVPRPSPRRPSGNLKLRFAEGKRAASAALSFYRKYLNKKYISASIFSLHKLT
jgi:hypothetical protein